MTRMDKTIMVWQFHEAPTELQALSDNGGDEDWLAFVPASFADTWIGWLESGGPFGVCCVTRHPVEGGWVYIGAHS